MKQYSKYPKKQSKRRGVVAFGVKKKWHFKSAHNRFKPMPVSREARCEVLFFQVQKEQSTANSSRSQSPLNNHNHQRKSSSSSSSSSSHQSAHLKHNKISRLIFISISLWLHISLTATTLQPASAASQSQVANNNNGSRLLTNATRTHQPSTSLSPAKLEDEVDLLSMRPTQQPVATDQQRHQNLNRPRPHIYKIRTAQLNGKLSLPLRINLNDGDDNNNDKIIDPSPISVKQRIAAKLTAADGKTQQQLDWTTAPMTKSTSTTTTTTTSTTSMVSPQPDAQQFGARASNWQQRTRHQQQQREPTTAGPPPNMNKTRESDPNCAGSLSTAASQHGDQGSISTSSQMLRLTPVNRTLAKFSLGSGGGLIGGSGGQPSVAPLTLTSSRNRPDSGRQGDAIEVDESELSAIGGELVAMRTQPTLISGKAPQPGNTNQRTTGGQSGHLGLRVGSSAEMSLVEPQATSSSSVESETPRSAGESILSLIDEYDSKIITNRTKAQLSCDSGEMILRLNFTESFKGIVYPDHNRLSPCRFFGDGHHNYELRLPLRGCGTRQAAPRVFVNDVIVRFHKTLELEEDEVKTLICRYPPPLAPTPIEGLGEQASGNSHSARPMDVGGVSIGGGEQETPNSQFEFVDPQSGRPTANGIGNSNKLPPEPGSTGNIETLSENLIVAPPSGQQPHHSFGQQQDFTPGATSLAPYNFNNNQNNNRLSGGIRHREQPVDLFNPRNSIVIGSNGGGSVEPPLSASGQPWAQKNFFERLSSIELLFMISSLMFLVLLALGLAASYYCFRRQAHRGASQRASAILKRKRPYVSAATLANHHHHHLHPPLVGPPTTLQPHYQRPRSHHRLPIRTTAPSSPESDLSGRANLLAGGSGGGAKHAYMYNRAFLPDGAHSGQQHYMTPVAATSMDQHQFNQIPVRASRHHGRRPHQLSEPADMTQQQQVPVLGRRETIYSYGGYGGQVSAGGGGGRQARYLSPSNQVQHYQHHHHQTRPMRVMTDKAHQQHEPLLTLTSSGSDSAEYTPTTDHRQAAGLTQRSSVRHFGEKDHQSLVSAKYAVVNKTRDSSEVTGPYRAQQVYVADREVGAPMHHPHRHLSRAKSMSSVHFDDPRYWQHREAVPPIGGTLSRHEKISSGLNNNIYRHHRQQFMVPEVGGGRFAPKQKQTQVIHGDGHHHRRQRMQFSSGSDSEVELNNNNTSSVGAGEGTQVVHSSQLRSDKVKHKSKILLKSMEDSYITNYTEIYEQEYTKRDSMQPLDVAKWRSLQPKVVASSLSAGAAAAATAAAQRREGESDRLSPSSSSLDNDEDNMRYQSAQTNLRSLTELDVNFAKTLIIPTTGVGDAATSKQQYALRPALSVDQLKGPSTGVSGEQVRGGGSSGRNSVDGATGGAGETSITTTTTTTSRQPADRQRSSSVPEVGGEVDTETVRRQTNDELNIAANNNKNRQESPDLILSPDYDYDRLELEPAGSVSSHNSVSYV